MKPRLYSFLLVMMLALACEAQNLIMTCGPYALRRPGTCALVHQGEGFASIIYAEGVREQCALFLGETEEESYENLMAMVRMIQREENEYYWPIDDSTTVWYNNFRGRHYVVINRVGQEGNVWLYSGYIYKMLTYFAKIVDKERQRMAADSAEQKKVIPTDDDYFPEDDKWAVPPGQ